MKREFTCIVCPKGCSIKAEYENGEITDISGNGCKRGEDYVRSEITCPKRVLTSTVKTYSGTMLAVKSNIPIPKEKMFECMREINSAKVHLPKLPGDVIIKNVCNTGADIVASARGLEMEV